MKGALIIFLAMVVIGVVLYLADIFYYRRRHITPEVLPPSPSDEGRDGVSDEPVDGGICCGTHVVCEKTNLSPLTGEIVYYDDEELDRFRGRAASEYTPDEVEEFRDVLLTLHPEDVAGWSRSIQVREISLPPEIRDELLMIVGEIRGF